MTLRIDSSRRLTWTLAGLVILLAVGFAWSIVRWRHAERQWQVAVQQLAELQYARSVAEAQRQIESVPAQTPLHILNPAETKALQGLPASDGPGVPAHIDAGMLIDGAEMNSRRAIGKVEPTESLDIGPSRAPRVQPHELPRVRP
jgi:hypothetical protein